MVKRVDEILNKKEIEINVENKIIWKNNPIARLKKGNDYLTPEIEIIADDSLNENSKLKLIKFLNNWLNLELKLTEFLYTDLVFKICLFLIHYLKIPFRIYYIMKKTCNYISHLIF